MRYLIILALLLPFAANATPYNEADCEFLTSYFGFCEEKPDGYCSGTIPGIRHQEADFMKRHSEKMLAPLCKRICAGELTPKAAFLKFCHRKGK